MKPLSKESLDIVKVSQKEKGWKNTNGSNRYEGTYFEKAFLFYIFDSPREKKALSTKILKSNIFVFKSRPYVDFGFRSQIWYKISLQFLILDFFIFAVYL